MIKLTATALIHYISPVIEIPSKTGGNPFQKRELILNDSYTAQDGTARPNFVCIEFTGDRMNLLDQFAPGMKVFIEACVNGRESNGRIFNTIRGLAIQPQQMVSAYPQQPQQGFQQSAYPQQASYPQSAPAPQPSYPQQSAFGQAPGGYPQQGYAQGQPMPQQPVQQSQSLGTADLPFPT